MFLFQVDRVYSSWYELLGHMFLFQVDRVYSGWYELLGHMFLFQVDRVYSSWYELLGHMFLFHRTEIFNRTLKTENKVKPDHLLHWFIDWYILVKTMWKPDHLLHWFIDWYILVKTMWKRGKRFILIFDGGKLWNYKLGLFNIKEFTRLLRNSAKKISLKIELT